MEHEVQIFPSSSTLPWRGGGHHHHTTARTPAGRMQDRQGRKAARSQLHSHCCTHTNARRRGGSQRGEEVRQQRHAQRDRGCQRPLPNRPHTQQTPWQANGVSQGPSCKYPTK